MPRKKAEETEAAVETQETETITDETAVEAQADSGEGDSVVDTVLETVASAAGAVVDTISSGAAAVAGAITGDGGTARVKKGKRAERIGVVSSDKMTKTVVVNVDRKVKHPIYRKYVRKRKKFMAHDELGAKTGDKVRIMETRPMSARKRWRVVEIIQKAEL